MLRILELPVNKGLWFLTFFFLPEQGFNYSASFGKKSGQKIFAIWRMECLQVLIFYF